MTFSVKVDGLKELDAQVKKLDFRKRKSVLIGAVRKAANVVRKKARELVPVKTGELKKSIKTKTEIVGDGAIGYVDVSHFTAHMVEFGTAAHKGHPGTAPQPFLRPAYDETQREQLVVMEKAIRDALGKL